MYPDSSRRYVLKRLIPNGVSVMSDQNCRDHSLGQRSTSTFLSVCHPDDIIASQAAANRVKDRTQKI